MNLSLPLKLLPPLWLATSPVSSADSPAADAFLDKPMAYPHENISDSYLDQLNGLSPLIGKKFILPPGLMELITKEKFSIGTFFYSPKDEGTWIPTREYLSRVAQRLDLNWTYDRTQDAIVFDFVWHQPPPPSADLGKMVRLLGTTTPQKAPPPDNSLQTRDRWETTFSALLSHPGNFPHAWKLRLRQSCHGWSSNDMLYEPEHFFSGLLKDASGNEHLLVLTVPDAMRITPCPPPLIFYYLLDREGHWEDGGTFEAGFNPDFPQAKLSSTRDRLTLERIESHDEKSSLDFSLQNGYIPTITSLGTFRWGTPSFAFDRAAGKLSLIFTAHASDVYSYHVTIDHGQLKGSYLKNGASFTALLFTEEGTPPRSAGD